jgi:uncharacterized protein
VVKTDAEVRAIVKKYLDYVTKEMPVTKAVLFGSYAKGNAVDGSDIDLAIESPDFGDNYIKDWQYLYRCIWRSGVDPMLEPRPIHVKMNPLINEEIKKHGIVVFETEASLSKQ